MPLRLDLVLVHLERQDGFELFVCLLGLDLIEGYGLFHLRLKFTLVDLK